jgi:hypothetical protein
MDHPYPHNGNKETNQITQIITMNMITVNRIDEVISGSLNGKQFGVTYDKAKFDLMKDLELRAANADTIEDLKAIVAEFEPLTKESYKELVETATPFIMVNKSSNKFYLHHNNKTSTKALPQAFVDRILTCIEKEVDVLPLIKCWVRFLRNPNYTDAKAQKFANYINKTYTDPAVVARFTKDGLTAEIANQKATAFQTPITQEGLLQTYKVSEEIVHRYELNENEEVVTKSRYKKSVDPDTGLVAYAEPEVMEDRLFRPAVMKNNGEEFFCAGIGMTSDKPGHFIKVGCVHWLKDWSSVNCNDSSTSVPGLHAGNLDYIRSYQNDGTVTHNVFIDPMDIGAVTNDGSGALRVRRYFVHSSFAGVNRSIYNSSRYAALTDAEFALMVDAMIEKHNTAKAELSEQFAEQEALR